MNELALFAGGGGGILAGRLLGWRTVCAVELDKFARRVLMARQDDGALEPFPIWDDVRTFDGRPWRGVVDVVSGGFPCQDISVAGKGAGIDGERSGLWGEFARIIREVGPRFVFVENSPALASRGLERVLMDLAALGYDAEWGVLGAGDVGANHRRERMWIVAYASEQCWPVDGREAFERRRLGADAPDADRLRELQPSGLKCKEQGRVGDGSCHSDRPRLAQRESKPCDDGAQLTPAVGADGRPAEPGLCRGDDGLAGRLDAHRWGDWREWGIPPTVGKLANRAARLRVLGNGQVPQCAAEAWRQLIRRTTA